MTKPLRIQRRRTPGWRMPANTVYVGRGSKWGNPYRSGMCDPNVRGVNRVMVGKSDLVKAYRGYAGRAMELDDDWVAPLHGKNLSCWCRLCPAHKDGKPFDVTCADCDPCHGDVLGEIANGGGT